MSMDALLERTPPALFLPVARPSVASHITCLFTDYTRDYRSVPTAYRHYQILSVVRVRLSV